MANKPLILYDLHGMNNWCFSPNVWKTRYTLNYKRIPYKTEWVEFPDIAALCARTRVPPTQRAKDGRPYYSVPIIYDPNTDTYIADSLAIALYLERAYPTSAPLFPRGSRALTALLQDVLAQRVMRPMLPLMLARVYAELSPRAQEYFRRTREAMFRKKLEDLAPVEQQAELWAGLEAGLGYLDECMKVNGEGTPFVMGEQLSYADVSLAGWLVWVKRLWGADSREWKELTQWHDGRWGKFMKEFERWENADDKPSAVKL